MDVVALFVKRGESLFREKEITFRVTSKGVTFQSALISI
jgi:hypothetical protein